MEKRKESTNEIFYTKNFAKHLNPQTSERLRAVLQLLANSHNHRLLDIGCGDGSFTSLLSDFCDEIYGVDIADEAVSSSIKKGTKALKADIDKEDFPFRNNFFDSIYCGDVIEHLYDPDHLIDEIYRMLVPGGKCILTTPNLASWLNRIVLLFGFQPFNTDVSLRRNVGKFKARSEEVSGHIRVFPYRSLIELLEWHDFTIEKAIGVSAVNNLPSPLRQLDRILSKRVSFASYVIIVVRRNT